MADGKSDELSGPDFKTGVAFSDLAENQPCLGHFDGEPVLLIRKGDEVRAIGAKCTHYGGPLAEGLITGETIRCPWHHAKFSLISGEAEGAPALDPVSCFAASVRNGQVTISRKIEPNFHVPRPQNPSSVVIVGAGAAGAACADMLRTKGYEGPVTVLGTEVPVDRPNLSKDFLAGTGPEEWVPLRPTPNVELLADDPATALTPKGHEVTLASGKKLSYGKLLLATGAEPRTLDVPGADLPNVHKLRSFADSKAIIAAAKKAKTCVVIGASFIGLEVAASLRARGLKVTVVGPDPVPLAGILGPDLGRFVQRLHEKHGVHFRLGMKPQAITRSQAKGEKADLVVLGVGVDPRVELARHAGLPVENGIVVDEHLLAATDIYAAGDIARYPDAFTGEKIRVEHWVAAQREGQAVARNMLGISGPYRDVPFFWSQHYDVRISYIGHASAWDTCEIKGDLTAQDACAIYRKEEKVQAVATIGRDVLSLQVEDAMERGDTGGLEAILFKQ